MLVGHSACVVMPLTADSWPPWASVIACWGRLDLSAALYLATIHDGYLLNPRAGRVRRPAKTPVIGFLADLVLVGPPGNPEEPPTCGHQYR